MDYQWLPLEGGLMALLRDGSLEDAADAYAKTLCFFDCSKGQAVSAHQLESWSFTVLGTMGDKVVLAGYNHEHGYDGTVVIYGVSGLLERHVFQGEASTEAYEAWAENWMSLCDYEAVHYWGEWLYLHPKRNNEAGALRRLAGYEDKSIYTNQGWYSNGWLLADAGGEQQLTFEAPRGVVLYNDTPGKWVSPKLEQLILCSDDDDGHTTYWLANIRSGQLQKLLMIDRAAWLNNNVTVGFVNESRGFLLGQAEETGMWGLWVFDFDDAL